MPKNAIALVVLESDGSKDYTYVKSVLDSRLRCNQCVVNAKVLKGGRTNPQYLANICLKMNAKLGGKNVKLDRSPDLFAKFNDNVLVCALDISHDICKQECSRQ